MDPNKIKQGWESGGRWGRGAQKKTTFLVGTNAPADDNAVVEQVDLDVLEPDGLVEALRDQQPQQPPQVWSVVQRHPHLGGEALQQRQQHGPRVDLSCMKEPQHMIRLMSRARRAERRLKDLTENHLVSHGCSPAEWRLSGRGQFPVSDAGLPPYSPP